MTELTDEQVDEALSAAIMFYDPTDKYPDWGNAMMRAAYRAGWEDAHGE